MKILILNGPNLNLLGVREPKIYGKESYLSLMNRAVKYGEARGVEVVCRQSNHEGDLIDEIQKTAGGAIDGILFNPGGYTHTSVALLDALRAVGTPTVEVHISDPDRRERFRRKNLIRRACIATVKGQGTDGYLRAMDILLETLGRKAKS